MINAIGNILGGGSAKISYAKKLAKAYEARVIADGGVVESLGCFTAFAEALGAYQPPIALAATGIGETSFTANWKPFKGAKYYLLDVSTSPTFATFVYENEIIPAPTTSYVVIGLNSNTTYYYRVRASTDDLFDADYQAVLDYATTQGYTLPTLSQQLKQNQLLLDLKAGGIWSKLDTFAVFATDGDSDFALIDWKRLTDYTAVNSPTFTANQGFQGNGTSSWINSNYNPSVSGNLLQASNANTTIYMNTINGAGLDFLYGAIDAFAIQLGEDNGPNTMRPDLLGNNSIVPSVPKIGAKWFSTNRTNSTENVFIQDTSATTVNNTFKGIPSVPIGILARNAGGGTVAFPTDRQASLFSAGESLISQNTDYRNAWLNYFTSL